MTSLGIGTIQKGRVVNFKGTNPNILQTGNTPQIEEMPPVKDELPPMNDSGSTTTGTQDLNIKDAMPSYMPFLFVAGFIAVAYLVLRD